MRCVALVATLCLAGTPRAGAEPGDWTVKRDPFDPGVVKKYKAILARDPYDAGALAALRSLYRRHRTLELLAQELAADDTWASRVVLAELAPPAKLDAVLAAWKQVVAADPRDARGWLAIGKLASDRGEAQVAYQHARELAATPAVKRDAVRGVLDLALVARDADGVDRAYGELVAMAPKDGRLWLERGDALIGLERWDLAWASYAAAEKLLATDPERRLYAVAQQARAHEGAGQLDVALVDYDRAIGLSPRGYYRVRELLSRVIEIHRSLGTANELLEKWLQRWPEKTRGFVEWSTLGQLYVDTSDLAAGADALRRAAAIDPTELATQHALVKLLDQMGDPAAAVKQLETAAHALPGDAPLHLELAERLHAAHSDKRAIAILQRIAARLPRNVDVRQGIADLYTKWHRPGLALKELEAIVEAEPENDHFVVLGDAYWEAGDETRAYTTWRRLAHDAKGYGRLGAVLAQHELWEDAVAAYTQAVHRDEHDPALWHARADLYELLGRWSEALQDSEQAVAHLGAVGLDAGHATRYQLVRLLARWQESQSGGDDGFAETELDWRARLDAGELAAGYMIAEIEGRVPPNAGTVQTLEKLRELAPDDRGVVMALARAYRSTGHPEKAIDELRALAERVPSEAQEVARQIDDIGRERIRKVEFEGWTAEGIPDPEASMHVCCRLHDPSQLPHRAGLRTALGVGLRGMTSELSLGVFAAPRVAPRLAWIVRLDYVERVFPMTSVTPAAGVSAIALASGVAQQIHAAPLITLGADLRAEARWGDLQRTGADRIGLAADATVEWIPRRVPASFGLQLEQGLSDHAQATALLLQLTIDGR